MRYATLLLLALTALAGCGDSESPGASTNTAPSTTAAPATSSPAPATTTPPPRTTSTPAAAADGEKARFVDVSSLLGKPLRDEPGCRFAKTFVADKPSPGAYDGALTLMVTCRKSEGYVPVGQIVNRPGSKPTQTICRDTRGGELYCVYVPNPSLGVYFTGTDRAVVRRRLERLIEIVESLPTRVTPLPGSSAR